MDSPVQRTHEDDPNRCQAVLNGIGQCNNKAVPGGKFCQAHDKGNTVKTQKSEAVRNYRLGQWQNRINEFADSSEVKSLREEIGIARIQMEQVLNKCHDDTDLLMYSERIGKLVDQIHRLVLAAQKLEEKSGTLLDKSQLFVICEGIVRIVTEHITDPDVLDIIAAKIMDLMTKSIATNPLSTPKETS